MQRASWSSIVRGAAALIGTAVPLGAAAADPACVPGGPRPQTSFIQYTSPNIATSPPTPLTIKGKLSVPVVFDATLRCFVAGTRLPTVLIVHGSSGVDSRGDFYQAALNDLGIATLQIDMWEARGVSGGTNRPALPAVDAARIGVLGFSWGGVMSLGSAEQLYTGQFGGGRRFKAHVAHYPVCYGANNTQILAGFGITPAQAGTQLLNLTGAPVLIQIGSEDDYDNGTEACSALAEAVNATNGPVVRVLPYAGAFHAWDRIMVPVTVADPFGNQGSYFTTGIVPTVRLEPNVELAYESRRRAVAFLKRSL
jgi:dienelactone hydrolase